MPEDLAGRDEPSLMQADRARPVVLHVLEAVGGGTAKHLLDLVRHVDHVRHAVAVPAHRIGGLSDEALVSRLRAAGAEVHVIPMQRSPISRRNARAVLRVRKLIRELRPDVVHAHASIGGAIARLAIAGTAVKLIWTPHAVNTGAGYAMVERRLFRNSTVVALSESERALIRRLRVGEAEALRVIPNGVPPSAPPTLFDLRAHFGIPDDAPIVGTIGRLVAQKAPTDFARACARIANQRPDVRFVYVGEGPLDGALDDEVARLGIQDRFYRLRLPSGAATVVGQFAAFLLCSRYEGAPYTPLEAMVAGVPVVLTDCVGSRDVVEHGHSGLLVPAGDAAAMGDAVLEILENDALRVQLRDNALARVATRFDIADMAVRYESLYREVAGSPATKPSRVPEVLSGYRTVTAVPETRRPQSAIADALELS